MPSSLELIPLDAFALRNLVEIKQLSRSLLGLAQLANPQFPRNSRPVRGVHRRSVILHTSQKAKMRQKLSFCHELINMILLMGVIVDLCILNNYAHCNFVALKCDLSPTLQGDQINVAVLFC